MQWILHEINESLAKLPTHVVCTWHLLSCLCSDWSRNTSSGAIIACLGVIITFPAIIRNGHLLICWCFCRRNKYNESTKEATKFSIMLFQGKIKFGKEKKGNPNKRYKSQYNANQKKSSQTKMPQRKQKCHNATTRGSGFYITIFAAFHLIDMPQ